MHTLIAFIDPGTAEVLSAEITALAAIIVALLNASGRGPDDPRDR